MKGNGTEPETITYGLNLDGLIPSLTRVQCISCRRDYDEQSALATDSRHRRICYSCRKEIRKGRNPHAINPRGTGGGYRRDP